MAITIDITKDGLYQKGKKAGLEKGKEETARNMLKRGLELGLIHEVTGVSMEVLQSWQRKSVQK